MYHFFIPFIQKLIQVHILTQSFRIVGSLTEQRKKCPIFHYKKKRISMIFMRLRLKRTSEMCHKIGNLNEKTKQNHLKMPTLLSFIQKITTFIGKLKALINFLL